MTRLPHAQAVIICNRAWRIVNRVMPDWSATPHGFHQTALFIERCQHSAARNRLYKDVWARLAAKVETAEQLPELKRTGTGGWL